MILGSLISKIDELGYSLLKQQKQVIFQVKKPLGYTLNLGNYNALVGGTYSVLKTLNKFITLDVPYTIVIV